MKISPFTLALISTLLTLPAFSAPFCGTPTVKLISVSSGVIPSVGAAPAHLYEGVSAEIRINGQIITSGSNFDSLIAKEAISLGKPLCVSAVTNRNEDDSTWIKTTLFIKY